MGGRLPYRSDSARGSHYERLGEARLSAALDERTEVTRHHRPEVRVDGRGGGALVLPELRRDLVGRDDVGVG